jgi:hypothetical protein
LRHLIQKQMAGDAEPAPAKSLLIHWGFYLLSEAEKGIKLDDLEYSKDDCRGNGPQPQRSGKGGVAVAGILTGEGLGFTLIREQTKESCLSVQYLHRQKCHFACAQGWLQGSP